MIYFLVFDATSKLQSGMVRGNVANFGDFEECIQVEKPDGSLTGKYCLGDISIEKCINESTQKEVCKQ